MISAPVSDPTCVAMSPAPCRFSGSMPSRGPAQRRRRSLRRAPITKLCSAAHCSRTVVPGPRILDAQLVVQTVHGEALAGRQLHDHLRHRTQVDDVGHGAVDDATSVRARLAGAQLDPLGAHRDRHLVSSDVARVGGEDPVVPRPGPSPASPSSRRSIRSVIRFEVPMKPGDERARRALVQLARRGELLDDPAVHHGDRVRHRHRLLLVVRDVDERRAGARLQLLQLQLHLLAELQVERARAARPAAARPVGSPARARAPRAAAGRRRAAPGRRSSIPSSGPRRITSATRVRISSRRELLDLRPERDVVGDRHVREQAVVLEHHVDVALGWAART